jgi:D-alanine--D-alanine ligase
MKISLTYNLRQKDEEAQAELLTQEDIDKILNALNELHHDVTPVEVTGTPEEIVDRILDSKPTLIFNVAEGTGEVVREAYYPAIFENLEIPYTGGNPSILLSSLDKRLLEKLYAIRGIDVPEAKFITKENLDDLESLPYPILVKPNFEGSSKGITQDSVVDSPEKGREIAKKLLEEYPAGLNVQQFLKGREFAVPMLEAYPGKLLEIVEYSYEEMTSEIPIYDFDQKDGKEEVKPIAPPDLSPKERQDILSLADNVFQMIKCPDLGRVDIRCDEAGKPYFLEVNALPRLLPDSSFAKGANAKGLSFNETISHIVRSAALRYGISLAAAVVPSEPKKKRRATVRETGISIGRYQPGEYNNITDVSNVHVGYVTRIEDDVPDPIEEGKKTAIRTGITAIVPNKNDLFNNHLVAGGFILNGIGEMSGLIQAMEWGWLETPILLTNTMSLGHVHSGVIDYMIEKHPELGRKADVIIPVIGETNDTFLNDVRIISNTADNAIEAIENAVDGKIEQGSVGSGTGMTSFDFAGGVGSSSRRLSREEGGYTVGVFVQANFGKLRNLTIEGKIVGRDLDQLYPYDSRRENNFGSVIVIVATDAPLLSTQLDRLSKRAALGLGRVGSHAASTSGELVFAFSTGNKASRKAKGMNRIMNLSFVTDEHIDPLYEAVVEATEEAVLNSMFCSGGMTGRNERYCPPIPSDTVLTILQDSGIAKTTDQTKE